MANGKFISYLRVSTARQGASGLGLEAQREAVSRYLNGGKWQLVQEVVEVESGKLADRPELAKGIGQVVFSHEDVIRHDLVGKIVAAYDRAAGKLAAAKAEKMEKRADGKADVRE